MASKHLLTVHTVTSAQEAASRAFTLFEQTMNRFIGLPILVLASGGSALKIWESPSKRTDFSLVTFGVLDERFTLDVTAHNLKKFMVTPYYLHAKHHGARELDMQVRKKESLSSYGKRIDQYIGDWIAHNKRGKIIITQGVGPDGHTAGVMPNGAKNSDFQQIFESQGKLFVGYDASYSDNPYTQRATVTLYFLEHYVDVSLLYVLGEDKKKALLNAMTGTNLSLTPAAVIQKMKEVHIVSDITV